MTLRIGLSIDPSMPRFLDVARQAERIGVDSVWVAEYWALRRVHAARRRRRGHRTAAARRRASPSSGRARRRCWR